MKKPKLYRSAETPSTATPGRARARKVALRAIGSAVGPFELVPPGSSTMMAMKPMAMSTAVPKKGPRQDRPPRRPPSSGPVAMPTPRAAS